MPYFYLCDIYCKTQASWVQNFLWTTCEELHLNNPLQRPSGGHTEPGISALFTHEETKVQRGDLTCPNHRVLQGRSLVLNSGLLAPSLRLCPLILRKQELSLRVDLWVMHGTTGITAARGIHVVLFCCTSWRLPSNTHTLYTSTQAVSYQATLTHYTHKHQLWFRAGCLLNILAPCPDIKPTSGR